jgi:hypothetical protein
MYEATIAYWLIKILNYSGVNPYKLFSYKGQDNKIRVAYLTVEQIER